MLTTPNHPIFTSSIAHSASLRYLIYSESDFEVFGPAGATPSRCIGGGEIWHGIQQLGGVEEIHHLCTIPQLCWLVSLQPRHVSTIGKSCYCCL